MSVIQDALKRKLEEQRAAKEEAPPAPPRRPPPPQAPSVAYQVIQNEAAAHPPRPAAPPPRVSEARYDTAVARTQQRTIRLLLVSILVLLTAGLVGALLYFLSSRQAEWAAASPGPRDSARYPAPAPQAATAPARPPPAPSLPEEGLTATLPTPVPVPPAADAAAEAEGGEPAWPILSVDGVLTGADPGRSSAILNGEMLRVNRRMDGVRLLEVSEEGVRLEFRGEERYVEIGDTTRD